MRVFLVLAAGLLIACSTGDDDKANADMGEASHDVEVTESSMMGLAGSEWNLGEGTNQFVAFKADGKIIGNGGCNAFNGTYTQKGETLTFGPLATTRKMCPEEIMQFETRLLKSLENTRSHMATHRTLATFDADDQPLMIFQRSDWD